MLTCLRDLQLAHQSGASADKSGVMRESTSSIRDSIFLSRSCKKIKVVIPDHSTEHPNFASDTTQYYNYTSQSQLNMIQNPFKNLFAWYQSMRNLVCRRSMTGKTCLRLVGILGLPVTMTGNFCQMLLYIQ